ncbi:MAG: 16S rRNA methyltransferase [Methanotrichaceae archaeon]|nr:16S rRNA methyltransferase [Methanotrichaceae archaeon]
MLNLLLVDSELELVPEEIALHPTVTASARRRKKPATKMLLDSSAHHSAMKRLSEFERRGRPDIVHFFLMVALESVLNHQGMLRAYVHTRNDQLICIDPSSRLPKSYPRFVGLMESLFIEGRVPSRGPALLSIQEGFSFEDCLREIPHSETVVLSEDGEPCRLKDCLKGKDDLLCVIGGFSHGDFRSNVFAAADRVLSIYEQPLTAWTVASEVIVNYENALDS